MSWSKRSEKGLWVVAIAAAVIGTPAQEDPDFIMRTAPYPLYYQNEPRDYNLKWGPLSARFNGSLQTELNDNINLSEHDPEGDLILNPQFGIGFMWPLSEKNVLQFDLGIGYRAYIDHPELNTLVITPGSRIDYKLRVRKVQVTVHDRYGIQVDPLSRPELSGGTSLINFRRFNNNAGVQASWEAIRDVTLIGGYDYTIDRSLTDDFTSLDRDDHSFNLGIYRPLGPRLMLGVASSHTISEYIEPVQNDGTSFSVGPTASMSLGEFITVETGVNYTVSEYEPTGTIQDQEDFSGMTFYTGVRHRMNSRTSHYARLSKNVNPGFGSNFTDIFAMQYGISARVMPEVTLSSTFVFEDVTASGALGEDSNRYLWYLGTQLRLSSRWALGLAYSIGWKDSRLPGRDYIQNRVTIDLTREF